MAAWFDILKPLGFGSVSLAERLVRPEAVTEQRAGCETADALLTKVTHPSPAQDPRQNCQLRQFTDRPPWDAQWQGAHH